MFRPEWKREQVSSIIGKQASSIKKEEVLYEEYWNDRKLLQGVDKVICLSQATRSLLIADYQLKSEKTTVIYNGLKDEGRTIAEEERKKMKQSLSFDAEDSIILFVGRPDSIKGVDFLIKAFRTKLSDVYPHARLILAGDGSFNTYLKKCSGIRSQITFTGKVDKEELYQYCRIADVKA